MTARDVEEAIVTPMLRLYAAPAHLRKNPGERRLALKEYVRCLERYPRSALEKIWQVVVEEYTVQDTWPAPGVLVAVGRRVYRGPLEPSDEERKIQSAREMSERYSARFMKTSQLAKLARSQGWVGRLRAYVEAASWVQAQLICGVREVGFDSVLTRHLGDFDSARDALRAYGETVRGTLGKGNIRVAVPRTLSNHWRSMAEGSRDGRSSPQSKQ